MKTERSGWRPWRREILLAAAAQKGRALLRNADNNFQSDREVALAAVGQGTLAGGRDAEWSCSPPDCGQDLPNDREIVLAAVAQGKNLTGGRGAEWSCTPQGRGQYLAER